MAREVRWNAPSNPHKTVSGYYVLRRERGGSWRVSRADAGDPTYWDAASEPYPAECLIPSGQRTLTDAAIPEAIQYQILAKYMDGSVTPKNLDDIAVVNTDWDHYVDIIPAFTYYDYKIGLTSWDLFDPPLVGEELSDGRPEADVLRLDSDNEPMGSYYLMQNMGGADSAYIVMHDDHNWVNDGDDGWVDNYGKRRTSMWDCPGCVSFRNWSISDPEYPSNRVVGYWNTGFYGRLYREGHLMISGYGVGIAMFDFWTGVPLNSNTAWVMCRFNNTYQDFNLFNSDIIDPTSDWFKIYGCLGPTSHNVYESFGNTIYNQFRPDNRPLFTPPPSWFPSNGYVNYREINLTVGNGSSGSTQANYNDPSCTNRWFTCLLRSNAPPSFALPNFIYRIRIIRKAT